MDVAIRYRGGSGGQRSTTSRPQKASTGRPMTGLCRAKKDTKQQNVSYGRDWYQQTRDAMNTRRSAREEMEMRREANWKANNGRDREDLYTDNWDGDVYKGNKVNVLSVLVGISILAPLVGIIFALKTYGTLWG